MLNIKSQSLKSFILFQRVIEIFFIHLIILLNLLLFFIISTFNVYADDKSICKTSTVSQKQVQVEAKQLSDLLVKFGNYEKITPDFKGIKCKERIIDHPHSDIITTVKLDAMKHYYLFERGKDFKLEKSNWIDLIGSMKKQRNSKSVESKQCSINKELREKIRLKGTKILKELAYSGV